MASFYERTILPPLLKCACSAPPIAKQRAKVVPHAKGRVLELGVGMGLNLAFYDPSEVESVTGVDPAPELRAIALAAPRPEGLDVAIEAGTAEDLPFGDGVFDDVVCTYTLCSVRDPAKALAEARRVLKPGGRLLFCEHGLSPEDGVAKWQRRIDPLWSRLFGGATSPDRSPRRSPPPALSSTGTQPCTCRRRRRSPDGMNGVWRAPNYQRVEKPTA